MGDARERARAAIREDLLDGYVTPEGCRDGYGVDPEGI